MDFSGRFISNFIQFAHRQGAELKELIDLTGLSQEELCKEETRVDMTIYNRVLEKSVQWTGDKWLGLHAGELMNLTAVGLIGQITQTCATVKEALDYSCEFASLGCRALPMKLKHESPRYVLAYIPNDSWFQTHSTAIKHTIDGILVFTIREFHALTLEQHFPLQLDYAYPDDGSGELERVMQCQINYNTAVTALYFDENHIQEPVITSNFELLRILVKHAEEKIQTMHEEQGFSSQVKQTIVNLVKPSFPTIQQVAANLNLSVRTVQRKLGNEGKTYKEIIESLRKEFALQYLQQNELTINEIAYLLDYAEASTFIRSFKRWYNQTPGDYRKDLTE